MNNSNTKLYELIKNLRNTNESQESIRKFIEMPNKYCDRFPAINCKQFDSNIEKLFKEYFNNTNSKGE